MYSYSYPRPAVTADCILLRRKAELEVLLIKRGNDPYKGQWAFPGGFMNIDETAEECVAREVEEETGLTDIVFEQVAAFSAVDRDPRGRTVTIAFLGALRSDQTPQAGDDAAQAHWFPVNALPTLAFDHQEIFNLAINQLKDKQLVFNELNSIQ